MKSKALFSLVFLTAVCPLLMSWRIFNKEYSRIDFSLGTVCSVRIFSKIKTSEAEAILDKVFAELNRLDSIFNANSGASELETVNQNAGIKPVKVSPELYKLAEMSLHFSKITGEAFNPAIGPLVKLWNIGFDNAAVPSETEIQKALLQSNPVNVALDNESIFLKEKGMRLDLGGIAKGFAADRVAAILHSAGIAHAVIDLGGNIFVLGSKPNGSLWQIGVKNPDINSDKQPVFTVKAESRTVVTSGNYERFFINNGKLYHHILDPKTGFPVENNLKAVTIVSNSSAHADALSTSCFVLGFEKSAELLKQFPDCGALFFFDDNTVFATDNIKNNTKILDKKYRFK